MNNKNNKKPNGEKLLITLIELLADQEGVVIEYQITKDGKVGEWRTTDKNGANAKKLLHERSK